MTMHFIEHEPDGTYRFSSTAMFFTVSRRILDDAVPTAVSSGTFGWIRGGLPVPDEKGMYIVEFTARTSVRVLAYVSPGAQIFATDNAHAEPFEGKPSLQFARYAQQEDDGVQRGCVEVRGTDDKMHVVAHYACTNGRFTISDSWFDFGCFAENLTFADALARCYLAFVQRCELGGKRIMDCGLEGIDRMMRSAVLPRVVHQIIRRVKSAEEAPGMCAPALARHLAHWLEDAQAHKLSESADALNLVRSAHYSDLFFVVPAAGKRPRVSVGTIGAIEGALDTYKLVKDKLADRAAQAGMAEVARLAQEVRIVMPPALPVRDQRETYESKTEAARDFDLPVYDAAMGEWSWRKTLSTALESIEAPYRVVAEFRGDVNTGEAAMISLVPAAGAMFKSAWDDASESWVSYSQEQREEQALRYAISEALACVSTVFTSSEKIKHVEFLGGSVDGAAPKGSPFADDSDDVSFDDDVAFWQKDREEDYRGAVSLRSVCRVSVSREAFFELTSEPEASNDPLGLWTALGGRIIDGDSAHDMLDGWPDALDLLERQNEAWRISHRGDYPEIADASLPVATRDSLGARYARDMRITFGSRRRHNAEMLADQLVEAHSDIESIRIARAMQDRVNDPFDNDALVRIMGSLANGSIDTSDQNAIVNCYLGEDPYMKALTQAHALLQTDRQQAISLLLEVIDKAERSGSYADGLEVVYRGFDTYSSRLMYNLIRAGKIEPSSTLFDFGRMDRGKSVELLPDSLYLCYSSAAYLVAQTFDGFDQGVRLARKTIEMAPTVVNGYRQLARCYTLVGDMSSACDILQAVLEICVSPIDTAIVYYQLGYANWKKGDAHLGAICYLKAMSTSSAIADQAGAELHELMREEDLPVVGRPEIDEGLQAAGVPVAPVDLVLDAVMNGAAAATDAGMFATARDLLTAGLHYRPDDVLVNVLRSLTSE